MTAQNNPSQPSSDKAHILYNALIGAAFAIIIGGFGYVLHLEGRISKLEGQFGFISGVASVPSGDNGAPTQPENPDVAAQRDEIRAAIGNGCAKYMESYDEIVSKGTLYIAENERLDALTRQMEMLGCNKVLK